MTTGRGAGAPGGGTADATGFGDPSDRIILRGIRARGRHGVLPAETDLGQVFVVDATLHVDTRAAAATDDLERTVDYGTLAQQLHDIVAGEPVALLERLAQRLADACLERASVHAVEITVHKPSAPVPVPFDDVAVSVLRRRA